MNQSNKQNQLYGEDINILVRNVMEIVERQIQYLTISIDNISDRLDAQNIELRIANSHETIRNNMREYLYALKSIKNCKTKEEFEQTKHKLERLSWQALITTEVFEYDISEELKK